MLNDSQLTALKGHTPAYVFEIAALKERVLFLRSMLPKRVRLCYAVKANPFLVRELHDLVDCLEICSPGELRICDFLGSDHEKYVLSGVYKDPALFSARIRRGDTAGVFTAESLSQLQLLQDASSAAGVCLKVLLRLTSGNQFGMSKEDVESAVANMASYDALSFDGIQFFSGTQKTSFRKVKRELESVDFFLKKLYDTYNYKAHTLEFGPGFAVSYFESESYDEEEFLARFSEALGAMEFDGQVTLEMGRAITASCGSYLTKVVDTKSNQSGNFAIVDGGMHQLVYYGQVMAMKHPHVTLFPAREASSDQYWTICGSLCTINDLLVKQLPAKDLQTGDLLIFEKTGAYCMTEGIALFLSRDLPEILLQEEDGHLKVVRRRFETSTLNCPDYEHCEEL